MWNGVDNRPGGAPPTEQTIVRSYKGKPEQAAALFQADAARLAQHGYQPVSQIYTPGSWGCGAFIIAVLLFILIIGILVFIYMILVKPAGTLVVTYQRANVTAQPAAALPTEGAPTGPGSVEGSGA